jgi:cell division protein FtsW
MMTCVAMGLLLRVSYELDRAERQVALLRGEAAPAAEAPLVADTPATAVAKMQTPTPKRGTSRLNARVEPTFERIA